MNCPRCGGNLFGNSWHKNYGAVCRTCGLLGTIELSPNICFIPDDTAGWFLNRYPPGGCGTPTTYSNMVSKPVTAAEVIDAAKKMNLIFPEVDYPVPLNPPLWEFPRRDQVIDWHDYGWGVPYNGGAPPYLYPPDRGECHQYSGFKNSLIFLPWGTAISPNYFGNPFTYNPFTYGEPVFEMSDSVKEMLNDSKEVSFAEENIRVSEELEKQVFRGLGIPAKLFEGESQLQRPEGGKGEDNQAKGPSEEGTGDSGEGTGPIIL